MNNNEKIVHVLENYDEYRPLLNKYVAVLEERYDWINTEKANHTDFIMNLSDLRREIERRLELQDLLNEYYKRGAVEAKKALDKAEDAQINDELMISVYEMFSKRYYDVNLAEESLNTYPLSDPINLIISAIEEEEHLPKINEEEAQRALQYISYYTQGIKVFQELEPDEVIKDLEALKTWCINYEIDESGLDYLIDIMEIKVELPDKPDPSDLLEMLHEARRPGAFISRGYTVLDYYRPYVSAMNHLRRVLREGREYRSVSNAIQRLDRVVENLRTYYETHYLQAGGMPRNTKANLSKYGISSESSRGEG